MMSGAIGAAQSLGTLSIVVNVAGGGVGRPTRTVGRDGSPHDMAAFTETMAKNTFGTFNVTRLAAAAMARNQPDGDGQRGVIVNTGSIAAYDGQVGSSSLRRSEGGHSRDDPAAGPRPRGCRNPRVRDRAWHHGHGHHAERVSGDPRPAPRNNRLPQARGPPAEFALLVESIIRNPYLNGENIRLDAAQRFPAK